MSLRTFAILCVLPAMATRVLAADGSSPNPLRSLDKTRLKAFVEAPLFDPTRRLPPPVAVLAAPPPPPVVTTEDPPPNLHLLGVIQGAHDIAIVRRGDDPKTETLSSGDHVGPWEVTVLPTVGIRLTSGTRAFDYALFTKAGAPTDPTAVSPTDTTSAIPSRDAGDARPPKRDD
jgi:hypothetical protein